MFLHANIKTKYCGQRKTGIMTNVLIPNGDRLTEGILRQKKKLVSLDLFRNAIKLNKYHLQ